MSQINLLIDNIEVPFVGRNDHIDEGLEHIITDCKVCKQPTRHKKKCDWYVDNNNLYLGMMYDCDKCQSTITMNYIGNKAINDYYNKKKGK